MNKFFESFKKKSFRYGTFSAVTAAVVIAVLIVINLIFSQLNLKWDLTREKRYSISDESRQILSGVSEKVTVYALYKTGQEGVIMSGQPFEPEIITELLDQYDNLSSNIEVIYKDPYLYPDFVRNYSGEENSIDVGSLIVECGDEFKIIPGNELYSVGYDDSASYYGIPQSYVKSIDLEPKLTNAIKYVVNGDAPVIYRVSGHGEYPVSENILARLDSAGYIVEEFETFNEESIPEDCDILFISQPTSMDYNEKETEIIRNYLENDGRAIFIEGGILDEQIGIGGLYSNMPNFEGISKGYGVEVEKGYIGEGDYGYMFNNSQINIIPRQVFSEIGSDTSARILIWGDLGFFAHPIKQNITKSTTKIESVLSTSKDSTAVSLSDNVNGMENGPFDLGVAVTDSTYTDTNHMTKLIVLSSLAFMSDDCDYYASGGNSGFVVSCIDWLNDSENNTYIAPKSLVSDDYISVGEAVRTKFIILVVLCVVIPVGILATGFVIWLKRRNK